LCVLLGFLEKGRDITWSQNIFIQKYSGVERDNLGVNIKLFTLGAVFALKKPNISKS
jgi:hypothetical protein